MDNKFYLIPIMVLLVSLGFLAFNINNKYNDFVTGNSVSCGSVYGISCNYGKVVCCNGYKYCDDCDDGFILDPNRCQGCMRAVGVLNIDSNPDGADVYVDDVKKGLTPLSLGDLAPGEYSVRWSKKGHVDDTKDVKIEISRITYASSNMIAIGLGSVEVMSSPGGAAVYLDDTYSGLTTLNIGNVNAGKHRLRISKKGYKDYSEVITVENDMETKINANLNE